MPAFLQLTNFALSVDSTVLCENINAQILDGQRVALVGENGSGKSTLLRAMATPPGLGTYYTASAGTITGELAERPQHAVLHVAQDELSWASLLHTSGLEEAELRELPLPEALEYALAGGHEEALEDEEFWRAHMVAAGATLHWDVSRYDTTPLGELSPGSALRAYLAIAIRRPSVKLLLLDEPTNHLDLPSILWLQQALLASRKAAVIVSHDGMFLDAVADHVWDLSAETRTLTVSGAKYSAFRHAQQVAREEQQAAYEQQQARHKRLTATAAKLQTASTAGSHYVGPDGDKLLRDFRRERAGRSGSKAKAILQRRDAQAAVEAVRDKPPMHIPLDPVKPGADSSIMCGEVLLERGGEALPLPPITLRLDFGERVGLVGFNGVGKSTLMDTLTGRIPCYTGTVSVGRQLTVGELTQLHASLPRDSTPRTYMGTAFGMAPLLAANCLIRYGLSLQQVDVAISELNPGARVRIVFAAFAQRKVNALLLDEPTNHLDEEAVTALIQALADFEGAVLLISHHRELLSSVRLDKVWQLSSAGLQEQESMAAYLDKIEADAEAVVAGM